VHFLWFKVCNAIVSDYSPSLVEITKVHALVPQSTWLILVRRYEQAFSELWFSTKPIAIRM